MNIGIFKILILAFLLFLVVSMLFSWWAVGIKLPKQSKLQVNKIDGIKVKNNAKTIKVVSYNIAHGQGLKNDPTDWRNEKVTKGHLEKISTVLAGIDADIVMMQEVDIDANRSHNINQALFLAKKNNYPYYACALVWDKNYVPYPFWPIKYHIGKVKSANCILSKFPLSNHQRKIFQKPQEHAWWYSMGYIDRGAQKLTVHVGNDKINLINIHLEAWSQATRYKQIAELTTFIDAKTPTILAGDFNAIPPMAKQRNNFIDEPEISYLTDKTIGMFDKSLPLNYSTSYHQQQKNNQFSYPANKPTRLLDYIYAFSGVKIVKSESYYLAKSASDHLPIVAQVAVFPKI